MMRGFWGFLFFACLPREDGGRYGPGARRAPERRAARAAARMANSFSFLF